MLEKYISRIATELNLRQNQVRNTCTLFSEGATIPFISRYRKEATGSLDEVQIGDISDLIEYYTKLEQRKQTILKSLTEQEKLTSELEKKIEATFSSTELEDIYLPFKPKKKTRASVAKEKGLEPLAKEIFAQKNHNIQSVISKYINEKVENEDEAIQGAQDIIAEWVSEDIPTRELLRKDFKEFGIVGSAMVRGKEEEGAKYKDYFKFEEPLHKCPSHRVMAILRGVNEGVLKVGVDLNEEIPVKTNIRLANKSIPPREFTYADRLKTSDSPTSQKAFQMEGPGWENDVVGFRNYFDARNGIDIYGTALECYA